MIGAEIMSRHVDPGDRNTAALFGDGAAAVVLRAERDESGLRIGAAAEEMFEADLSRSKEIRLRGRTARAQQRR